LARREHDESRKVPQVFVFKSSYQIAPGYFSGEPLVVLEPQERFTVYEGTVTDKI
jgi:hypothetical protein